MLSKITILGVIMALLLAACAPAAVTTEAPALPTEAPVMTEAPTEAPVMTEAPTEAPVMTEAPTEEPVMTEAPAEEPTEPPAGEVVVATPGQELDMVFLPKNLGNAVFDEAHEGALEAAGELQNPAELQYLAPASGAAGTDQIPIITNATTQGVNAIMISNNAGDQIAPAAQEARDAGITVVTWDSPIPSGEGEQVFVAQVDFDETGTVMADMALNILGDDGGQFAVLSASPDAANQNAWIAAMQEVLEADPKYASLELLEIVYGNDVSEDSYQQALALVDKYPDMELIMAPTTVGIAAAAKAMQDEGLCETVKVSGLGPPSEMASFVENGCSPEFALWSFKDLGYLTYYLAYLIASGALQGVEGEQFEAGRMGQYTIEKDPTREVGLRVLMGPFSRYNPENIAEAVSP
jgi:rhamnose transport system substrate-binding protein